MCIGIYKFTSKFYIETQLDDSSTVSVGATLTVPPISGRPSSLSRNLASTSTRLGITPVSLLSRLQPQTTTQFEKVFCHGLCNNQIEHFEKSSELTRRYLSDNFTYFREGWHSRHCELVTFCDTASREPSGWKTRLGYPTCDQCLSVISHNNCHIKRLEALQYKDEETKKVP